MVSGAGAFLWFLSLQVQVPGAPIAPPALLPSPAPVAPAGGASPGETLVHPVRLELDRADPGWRLERLEVHLDGVLLARRDRADDGPAQGPSPTPLDQAWSGEVADDGEHVLSASLVLRSTSDRDGDGRPLEVRVERARRFRAAPSQMLALLIQAPGGGDQLPQVVLSAHGR